MKAAFYFPRCSSLRSSSPTHQTRQLASPVSPQVCHFSYSVSPSPIHPLFLPPSLIPLAVLVSALCSLNKKVVPKVPRGECYHRPARCSPKRQRKDRLSRLPGIIKTCTTPASRRLEIYIYMCTTMYSGLSVYVGDVHICACVCEY